MGLFISNGKTIDTNVGGRIKAWREQKQLTTYELAEMLGWSQSLVTKMERGERSLTMLNAEHLSKTCDIDYIWLLTGLNHDANRKK